MCVRGDTARSKTELGENEATIRVTNTVLDGRATLTIALPECLSLHASALSMVLPS